MSLQSIIEQHQVVIGMVGATVTGGLLFGLRQLPGKLLALLIEFFAVTLIVDSDEEVYSHLNVWLARHRVARRARRLMMEQSYAYDLGRWGWEFTIGQGWHLLLYQGSLLAVHRHIQEAAALDRLVGSGKKARLTVYTLGRSQAPVRQLMADAKAAHGGGGLVAVYFWHQGCYRLADKRPARSLDTVFMPEKQKRRIIDDALWFVGARETYRERGVPHRRGYLLEGPPGTGKSTLIYVLAGVIDRAIYTINLNNVSGDNDLMSAFNEVGPDGIIALEDVDTCRIAKDREAAPAPGVALVIGPQSQNQVGVTLSGLLNAIDGIAAREGRILFMTSNHADNLDPALLRSGRVDMRERIDRLGEPEAWTMFQAFRPDEPRAAFAELMAGRLPISPADLQNLLLGRDADIEQQGVAA